jgi:protein-tyrosine phosphatase
MESISNFRELGGLPVADGAIGPGRLFRSGHLGRLSDAEADRLGELGIRTILDLRSDRDIADEGPDRVPAGIQHHRVPIHDDAGGGAGMREIIMRGDLDELREMMGEGRGHALARDGSAQFVQNPQRRAAFAAAMGIVLDPDNWPVLWHCSGGKDRAGWVATSALLLAGASTETIVEHYVESNTAVGAAAWLEDGELKDLITPFLGVHEDYVRAQLAAVEELWGGAEGLFSDGYGIGPDAVDRFLAALVATDTQA